MVNNFLEQVYFQNRVIDYIIALVIFGTAILTIIILKNFLIGILKRQALKKTTTIDERFVETVQNKLKPSINLLYFAAFYFSFNQLKISIIVEKYFKLLIVVLFIYYIARFILSISSYFIENYWLKKEKNSSRITAARGIETFLKIVVWSIAFIILLDNLGIQISALLAGLGIGGIAIALASQNILGDLFSYFIIYFDRPFEIGDFLVIDNFSGSVENIGIKTTRIRSLGGEELIFSNTNLVNSRLRNYKRMRKRRVSFNFKVTYQTSLEQLKAIPDLVTSIFQKIDRATLDRVHFSSFGDFSLIFEVVYYVNGRDYKLYMDIQQEINLRLKEELEKRKIEIAYLPPTMLLAGKENK
ncbi:MAG: mechanosensitive ion channel family protein [Candidatus Atribacteria bacterium]|jgi:small-conductance mechanosensitive channel|nr:mechanosensitive ion channel family protein [Candidatus Atribacteria bacterium]